VEFHRMPDGEEPETGGSGRPVGIRLTGVRGWWTPFPVEYKRGSPKKERWDAVQLCAEALCLEEMLTVLIPEGALFYGETRRRHEERFDSALREETEELARLLHELTGKGVTPRAEYASRCKRCSLLSQCLPQVTGRSRSARMYVERSLAARESAAGGDGDP
jgi:CRISPR-associated exonuclease Cas4